MRKCRKSTCCIWYSGGSNQPAGPGRVSSTVGSSGLHLPPLSSAVYLKIFSDFTPIFRFLHLLYWKCVIRLLSQIIAFEHTVEGTPSVIVHAISIPIETFCNTIQCYYRHIVQWSGSQRQCTLIRTFGFLSYTNGLYTVQVCMQYNLVLEDLPTQANTLGVTVPIYS